MQYAPRVLQLVLDGRVPHRYGLHHFQRRCSSTLSLVTCCSRVRGGHARARISRRSHWAMEHASGQRTVQLSKLCTRCQPLCAYNSYLRSVECPRATRWTHFLRSQSSRVAFIWRAALAGTRGEVGALHRAFEFCLSPSPVLIPCSPKKYGTVPVLCIERMLI